jgi:integrase
LRVVHFSLDDPDANNVTNLEWWCLAKADEILVASGISGENGNRLTVAKAVSRAMQRASQALAQAAEGDFQHINAHALTSQPPRQEVSEAPLPFETVFSGWADEKRPAKKTSYEWKRVLSELQQVVGHNDARRVRPEDLVKWKTNMLASGLRGKTIRDAKLAPVRAIFGWAAANRWLPSNPAEGITVGVKHKPGESKRGFSENEAEIILTTAARESDPVRRWVPWLCAWTGARVSEICQLRTTDVIQLNGVWCIKIDPEAGPLKNQNSERVIPLHSALVESGFLDMVHRTDPGPIFAGLPPDKFGKRGGNGTKVLGPWVRSLGLTDSRLSPSHSWRHRFKTLCRQYGLAPDIVDAIRAESDHVGSYPAAAK